MSQQEQPVEQSLFNFDTIVESEIIKVEDTSTLPYNPFTFDITLSIIKTQPPFENNLSFQIKSGCKSVFGRKKADVEHVLKAPTVSSRHFVIDENQKIADLGSTKGTFIWVEKDKSINLEEGMIFLVGKVQINIERIYFEERKILFRIQSKVYEITQKDHLYLFGSHQKCQFKMQGKFYMACLDVHNLKFYTFLEKEDCEFEQGVWIRLSGSKDESDPRALESDDLIMVFPYVLKVEY